MKRRSLRVYLMHHHDGNVTGVLLRTWDWVFDRPPPSAYGATEEDVLVGLEAEVRAMIASGEDDLSRYLWDDDFQLRTIRVEVHPQSTLRGAQVIGKRPIPLHMSYLWSKVPDAGYRIMVPRFSWWFIVEDLAVAREVLRQAVSSALLGELPRSVFDFRMDGTEHVMTWNPSLVSSHGQDEEDLDPFPVVRSVAEELVERAARRKLPAVFGTSSELEEAMPWVEREPPTSLLLVGPPGVGKTAWVHRLAMRFATWKRVEGRPRVPRIWSTSLSRILAGMRFLGMWQKRCLDMVHELAFEGDYLSVGSLVDILRPQPDGTSVGRILIDAASDGEISLIAECTDAELDVVSRRDPSALGVFQVLRLPEPSRSELPSWVHAVQERRKSKVRLHPAAARRLVHHLATFRPDTAFPGKLFRFLDWLETHEGMGKALASSRTLYPRDVSETFSSYSGLPVSLIADEVPSSSDSLAAELAAAVVGQDEACRVAASVLARFKAGLNDPERPCGTLLFTGPTGVGKTELAKQLTKAMFGDPARAIRLDMSEYMLPGSAARLLDASPNVDSLARKVRRQPLCLVLFDEIEKAHPEVFDLLLSVLGEGRLTDEDGRLVDFRMALIVMTSNLGASMSRPVGFGDAAGAPADAPAGAPAHAALHAARTFFRPEMVNRIDHVVGFRPLGLEDVQRIVDLEVTKVRSRPGLLRRGIDVRITPEARRRLAELGFDPQRGARPLKRVIEERVVAPIAAWMAANPEVSGRAVRVDVERGGGITVG